MNGRPWDSDRKYTNLLKPVTSIGKSYMQELLAQELELANLLGTGISISPRNPRKKVTGEIHLSRREVKEMSS